MNNTISRRNAKVGSAYTSRIVKVTTAVAVVLAAAVTFYGLFLA